MDYLYFYRPRIFMFMYVICHDMCTLISHSQRDCVMTGTLPEDFFVHFPALVEIDLRLNELKGPLPPDLLQCRHLQGLYLFDNYLTGVIYCFHI